MARWRMWAASAIGATAAGAGLAAARRRGSRQAPQGEIAAPPPPPAPPPTLPNEGSVPPAHAPAEDDPQAALDAARDRLRDRADALRREIESAEGGAPGGG